MLPCAASAVVSRKVMEQYRVYNGEILTTSVTLCALWGLGPLHPCDERTAENTGMMRKSVVLPGEAGRLCTTDVTVRISCVSGHI